MRQSCRQKTGCVPWGVPWAAVSVDAAAKEAAARQALGPQILADAARLVAAWNARQVARTPCCSRRRSVPPSQLGSGSCGCAAPPAEPSMLPTCGTGLIPWLSCRPHSPFAEIVHLSPPNIANEMRKENRRRVLGE